MSTCIRSGAAYKRHDYRKNKKVCSRCKHERPEKKRKVQA